MPARLPAHRLSTRPAAPRAGPIDARIANGAERPAPGRSGGLDQGPVRHRGRDHRRRLDGARRRRPCRGRLPRRGAAARRGRCLHRPHQHERVRLLRRRHQPAPRHAGRMPHRRRAARSPRIPGGSTSGGAVSVAGGAAWAALGSDTGGSIRIPAALQGLVGFKNTARLTPTEGAIPLSTTLDTACAITRSVRDAVAAARDPRRTDRRPAAPTAGRAPPGGAGDADARRPRACRRRGLRARAGNGCAPPVRGSRTSRSPSSARSPRINATGGFSPAEAWAWHRHRLAARGARTTTRGSPRGSAAARR